MREMRGAVASRLTVPGAQEAQERVRGKKKERVTKTKKDKTIHVTQLTPLEDSRIFVMQLKAQNS
jgi:hypothetical protein